MKASNDFLKLFAVCVRLLCATIAGCFYFSAAVRARNKCNTCLAFFLLLCRAVGLLLGPTNMAYRDILPENRWLLRLYVILVGMKKKGRLFIYAHFVFNGNHKRMPYGAVCRIHQTLRICTHFVVQRDRRESWPIHTRNHMAGPGPSVDCGLLFYAQYVRSGRHGPHNVVSTRPPSGELGNENFCLAFD